MTEIQDTNDGPAQQALDLLFRENELAMSDRNGKLYDTISAALAAPAPQAAAEPDSDESRAAFCAATEADGNLTRWQVWRTAVDWASKAAPTGAAPAVAHGNGAALGFDECAASGQSCSYGLHGPDGEMQCRYCGKEQSPAPAVAADELTDEQIRDALEAEFLGEPGMRNLANDIRVARAAIAQLQQYQAVQPLTDEQCLGDPGECGYNGACMYACSKTARGIGTTGGEAQANGAGQGSES